MKQTTISFPTFSAKSVVLTCGVLIAIAAIIAGLNTSQSDLESWIRSFAGKPQLSYCSDDRSQWRTLPYQVQQQLEKNCTEMSKQ